jgi:phospholipase C
MKLIGLLAGFLSALLMTSVSASPISHIIVLMMENRSFDHLLGWLKSVNSKIDGLVDGMSTPRDPNDASKGEIPITRNGYDVSPDDPKHDFDSIVVQLNDDKMDGFVLDAINNHHVEENPVSMFDSDSAPIINLLAQEFALFDSWFCSIPGPTDPNRQFAMSGTSNGVLNNFNGSLYTQQTYLDYITQYNRSFAGYYQDDLWILGAFQDLVKPKNFKNIKNLDKHFYKDVADGNLADFTWMQPRMTVNKKGDMPSWQHPDASVLLGEQLIKDVYEALRAGPKWNETLLLITYDEHGGFFDHVAPPGGDGVVPAPDDKVAENGYTFNSLGIRVPTLAISPWVAKGTVVKTDTFPNERPTATSAFDATSVLATSNILLNITGPPLGDRMAWANTFAGLFSSEFSGLKEPRTDCPSELPALSLFENEAARSSAFETQRAKPINEPMLGQMVYFCTVNHPVLHQAGKCPGLPEELAAKLQMLVSSDHPSATGFGFNQGQASDWLMEQRELFLKKY